MASVRAPSPGGCLVIRSSEPAPPPPPLADVLYRTVYYFLRHNPLPFKVTGIMTICWDVAVLCQRIYYGAAPPYELALEGDDEEGRTGRGVAEESDDEDGGDGEREALRLSRDGGRS